MQCELSYLYGYQSWCERAITDTYFNILYLVGEIKSLCIKSRGEISCIKCLSTATLSNMKYRFTPGLVVMFLDFESYCFDELDCPAYSNLQERECLHDSVQRPMLE